MATSTTAIGALRVGLGRACGSSSQQGRSFLASSRLPAIDGGPRAPHLSPTRTQSLVPSSTSRSFVTTTGGTFCDRDVSSRHFSSAAATSTTSTTALPDGSDIRILPNGVKQLKKLLEKDPDRSLRLTVNSGGCSGYQYEFKMEKTRQPDDIVIEQDGVTLLVDGLSLEFLGDCDIDYTAEMIRASFQVVKNSAADNGCGCGASFSVSAGF